MSVSDEGTIRFWLQDRHPDWATDARGYNFGTKHPKGLVLKAMKHPDKTVELILDGLRGQTISLRQPIPKCDARGLHVGITWSKAEVVLYLNGKVRQTLPSSGSQTELADDAPGATVTG
jgi:hypothetical protein